jgi:hypothetical protein
MKKLKVAGLSSNVGAPRQLCVKKMYFANPAPVLLWPVEFMMWPASGALSIAYKYNSL